MATQQSTDQIARLIPDLRAALRGQVITPDDPAYDEARTPQIAVVDRRPAVIARVADVADVSRVVTFAREHDVELAIRSGGHSLAGHSSTDGGVLLDLSAMKSLDLDLDGRTAWVESGMTTGEYAAVTAAHGLATGFGDTATVGIGGITLAGGIGYLVRKYGLTIDSLLAAEIVTADGEVRFVDAEHEPDLFWAIRGGGGNLGVVTRFRFRLHEVDTIVGGMMMLPATPETIAAFVTRSEAAPEELSSIAIVMKAPPMPFVPAEHHGQPIIMAMMCYAGDTEAGERAIAPFRAIAQPIVDMVGPKRYPEMFPPDEQGPPLENVTVRTMFVDRIGLPEAKEIIERLQASTAPMAAIQIRVLGGAVARVPVDDTAFAYRSSPIFMTVAAMYGSPDDAPIYAPWVGGVADALRQGDASAYTGFMTDEGEVGVHAAYPGATWDRLAAIKARYDPTNLFRLNQNVPPASVDRGQAVAE